MAKPSRERDIPVNTDVGNFSLTIHNLASGIITTYEAHRSHYENMPPFTSIEWKYYEYQKGNPKKCQIFGNRKDGTGLCQGMSMWNPHCFPLSVLNAPMRSGSKVKCKILKSDYVLPNEFVVLLDRQYKASINGNEVIFTHYLLSPSGQYQESEINRAINELKLIQKECSFGACSEPHNFYAFDFSDCENAVGPMYAAQLAIKCLTNDQNNSVSDRCDALILYAWLGSLELTIDELVDVSPWASEFILKAMKKYGQYLPNDSNIAMNYGDAVDSLIFQLKQLLC
eukprot:gene25006-32583_t